MDAAFTPEHEELRSGARAFLSATPEPSWSELAALGWTGVSVAVEHGGAGLGFIEEGIVLEELARVLAPAPYLATVAGLLPALPADEQARVASGEASWVLSGGPLVPNLNLVTNVAIVGGDGIYELVGFEHELLATLDDTRPLGVVMGGDVGRRLAGSDWVPRLRARTLAALALEAGGVGTRALELALDHARVRTQFGTPIGAFQAVAHPLADVFKQLELGRSLAVWASWCLAVDDPDSGLAAAAAKAVAADAAVFACEQAIQAQGGSGFVWENPLRRLYARALGIRSWEAGSAQLHGEIAAELLEGGNARWTA
jgi:alkylation response protein AidB-like acyl-CoA dehydrogenase